MLFRSDSHFVGESVVFFTYRNYAGIWGIVMLAGDKLSAYEAGRTAWNDSFSFDNTPDFPVDNSFYQDDLTAKAFRAGFDDAARKDGYTYSRVDGEWHEGGKFEFETDEFPEPGDL